LYILLFVGTCFCILYAVSWCAVVILYDFSFYISLMQSIKGVGHTNPSNIGDLFSEGSLNPYADDPYAFD